MKRIQTLHTATLGLMEYTSQSGVGSNWNRFRDYDDGSAYRELRQALVDIQHGLCGYCEIDLTCNDRQIEHVIPRSDPSVGETYALDPANMMACCIGGTGKNLFGPGASEGDSERFLEPAKDNQSCGQAKGHSSDQSFVDPRTLPDLPSLLRVYDDGQLVVDEISCTAAGVSVCGLNRTVEILGLNVPRLRRAREERWKDFTETWADHLDDAQVMERLAREELLPDANGVLVKLFTTNRSYFSPFSEKVLAEHPREWI